MRASLVSAAAILLSAVFARPAAAQEADEPSKEKWYRLGGLVTYWSAGIHDVRLAKKRQGWGGGTFDLEEDGGVELRRAHAPFVRVEGGAGPVSLRMSVRGAAWHDTGTVDEIFDYGYVRFTQGAPIRAKLSLHVVDSDVLFHVSDLGPVKLELGPCLRYAYTQSEINDRVGLGIHESLRHQGFTPGVAAGVVVKPFERLELFARGRAGHWYQRISRGEAFLPHAGVPPGAASAGAFQGAPYSRKRNKHRETRRHTSFELEAGAKVVIHEFVGAVLGYRFDQLAMLYRTHSTVKRTEYLTEGLFGGVAIDF